jgi:hypothetical protein
VAVLLLGGTSPQRYTIAEDTTVYNPDSAISVLVGDTSSPDTPIPPEGAFILSGGRTYWFQRADGSSGQVDLLRGLTGAVPSPIQIATGLTNSGLAAAIAADMIAAGVATLAEQQTTQTTLTTGIALPANAAQETGGNLATAATHAANIETNTGGGGIIGQLAGSFPSALVSAAGLHIASDFLAANTGVTKETAAQMLHANQGVTTELAALIASGSPSGTPGGVPLLTGNTALGSQTGVSLGFNGFNTYGPFVVTQPGYEMYVSLAYASSTPGGDPTTITLIWEDNATANHIESEQFDVFPGASTGNAHIICFKGPSKASRILIQFNNTDSLSNVTMSYIFWQNSRVLPRSIGKTFQNPTMFAASTYFTGFGNVARNIIGSYTNAGLAGGNSEQVITSFYNGDVMLNLTSGITVNPPLSIQGYAVDSVGTGAPVYQATQQTDQGINDVVSLPRAQMVWIIKNNDASNAHLVNLSLVAKEEGS